MTENKLPKFKPDYPLYKDIFISMIITGSLLLGLIIIELDLTKLDITLFVSLLSIIFGFLLTVLTIIFSFEDKFKNNPVFVEFKNKNKINKLYELYLNSIKVIFFSVISLIILYFIISSPIIVNIFVCYTVYYLFLLLVSLSFLRTHHCYRIFIKTTKLFNNNDNKEELL